MPFCFASEMSLTYDANGNLVTGDGKFRTYNSLNQLSKVYNGSDTSILLEEYTYHPAEERVWVKKSYNLSGSLIETVYYINQNRLIIQNLTGTYNYTYVYHEGFLVAQINPDGTKTFFATDLKGNVVAVTNSSGQVIERTSYSPTGEILTGGRQSRFSYEGKETDTGLGYIPLGGLVSYWSFNDGTNDEVTGNNGVPINATRTSGIVRDAYALDGRGDFIVVNDSSSLDVSSGMTLSMWFYVAGNTQGYLMNKPGAFMMQYQGSPNNSTQAGIYSNGTWIGLVNSGALPLNTWINVIFTYNQSKAYLYINGVQVNSGTSTSPIDTNNNSVYIGAKNSTDRTRDFNGSIDEIGIWNRALSASAVKSLYNYGKNYDDDAATDFHARMYNPPLFEQPDTVIKDWYSPQSLNRYSFEGNSPSNRVDPSGHFVVLFTILIAAVVYASFYAAGNAAVDYFSQTYDLMSNQKMSYSQSRQEILTNPNRQSSIKNSAKSGAIWGGASGGAGEALNQISLRSGESNIKSNSQKSLYHYTNEQGMKGIVESNKLNPSLKQNNPFDARYGNGQYLSDITPGTKTSGQLSRNFINNPFQSSKYTNYVEIDVTDLTVIKGREGVYLIPNEKSLDLTNRIMSYGEVK
jgi:hypothetical protein